jgi:hypothetical protein
MPMINIDAPQDNSTVPSNFSAMGVPRNNDTQVYGILTRTQGGTVENYPNPPGFPANVVADSFTINFPAAPPGKWTLKITGVQSQAVSTINISP